MNVGMLLKGKERAGVVVIDQRASVAEAARLMMQHGIGGLPVVDGTGSPLGFVSEREIVAALDRGSEDIRGARVSDVMRRPAPLCSADDSVNDVMARMTRERLRHLIIMGGGTIAGVISVGDLVKHRLEQLETEAGVLRDYVAAQRAKS
jgi:CBS domain-containing protein